MAQNRNFASAKTERILSSSSGRPSRSFISNVLHLEDHLKRSSKEKWIMPGNSNALSLNASCTRRWSVYSPTTGCSLISSFGCVRRGKFKIQPTCWIGTDGCHGAENTSNMLNQMSSVNSCISNKTWFHFHSRSCLWRHWQLKLEV